jgi:predicted lipoprotein with Yx(FWY)xxD motif
MKAHNRLTISTMLLFACTLFFASFAAAAGLKVATKDGIGSYLTDDKGMALYIFTKDSPDKSVCMADNGCLTRWPVFFGEQIDSGSGIDPAAVGTITRDDGLQQTTYKGQPLYYFFMDKDPDDVYGQGVKNVWFVVAP